ncbi:Emopamil binding protein-domain-containing protein [Blastocladiella britannica]|nr:Emopamil binding protein-domain-containing protein [Blastocladiella britannica]
MSATTGNTVWSSIVPRKMSSHPYYPRTLDLPTYVPNSYPGELIFGGFGIVCAGVFFTALALSRHLSVTRRAVFVWCVLSGAIHMFLEAYFVWYYAELPAMTTPTAMVWKEYARCDSRYLWGERGVWMIEAITGFVWGPLLWYIAARLRSAPSKTHTYMPWLLMVSVGQFYGTVLYFATSLRVEPLTPSQNLNGASLLEWATSVASRTVYDDGDPHPYYFWVYFVLMNAMWLVVPAACGTWAMCDLLRGPGRVVGTAPARAKVSAERKKR